MYKETIITYLVWTEWNPTTPIPIVTLWAEQLPNKPHEQVTTVQPIYTIRILHPIIFLWSDPIRKLILFVCMVVAGGGGVVL